jgi:hypothetical protein
MLRELYGFLLTLITLLICLIFRKKYRESYYDEPQYIYYGNGEKETMNILRNEYRNFVISSELEEYVKTATTNISMHREVLNGIERILMHRYNQQTNIGETEIELFQVSPESDEINVKFYEEMEKKKITIGKDVVLKINELCEKYESVNCGNELPKIIDEKVVYNKFSADVFPRFLMRVEESGIVLATTSLMRYTASYMRGQHFGPPVSVTNYLYDNFGLRGEGFASPFNSRLMGKKGTSVCSLFSDVDMPLGTIGSFYTITMGDHAKVWTVDPPYIEKLLTQACIIVDEALRTTPNMTVFLLFPDWETLEDLDKIESSEFLVHAFDLPKNEHKMETPIGSVINVANANKYYVMSNDKELDTQTLITELGKLLFQ